jgi:hypothetical protein
MRKNISINRACSTNLIRGNAYRILMAEREEERLLGRPRCRWVDYAKMYLRNILWGSMD